MEASKNAYLKICESLQQDPQLDELEQLAAMQKVMQELALRSPDFSCSNYA